MPDQRERKHRALVLNIGAGQSRYLLIASSEASAREDR